MNAIPKERLKLQPPSRSMEELLEKYGLMPDDIAATARKVIERKHGG
jgi:hypothetical protein